MTTVTHSRLKHIFILCASLISLNVSALGLGDITLHSRVGEPLRAEVPVYTNEAQPINSDCFALAPLHGADLPVITAAKIRLVRLDSGHRLIITGNRPINEPLFMIGLRTSCDNELQRDYVLMPSAPLALTNYADLPANTMTTGPTAGATVHRQKPAKTTEWLAHEGETLESIAEARSNGRLSQQRRILAGLKRANPEIEPEQYLSEGTAVHVPNMNRPVAAETPPAVKESSLTSPPRASTKAKPSAPPQPAPSGGDRIILGGEPETLKPGELAIAPRSEIRQMEDRMLKMETTLRTLNQQVDSLNTAIDATTEAITLLQKLTVAQSSLHVTALAQPVPPPQKGDWTNWLELGISALLGGLFASSLAYFFSRPRYQTLDIQAPLKPSLSKGWWKKSVR